MATTEDHLRYLEGALDVLEDYLFSSEMFWAIGLPAAKAGTELPRLSMGGLLLAWELVKAGPRSADQNQRFEKVNTQIEAIRSHWRMAWGKKCMHSFHLRLVMWRNYLEEYREDPEENADRYAYQVRWRVMLHLLQLDAQEIDAAELGLLKTMDILLRQVLRPGDFIWEKGQAAVFPVREYWYLYGSLPRELN